MEGEHKEIEAKPITIGNSRGFIIPKHIDKLNKKKYKIIFFEVG